MNLFERTEEAVDGVDAEKQLAAEAAAMLVEDGMKLGLGTGSTVAYLLPAIARRGLSVRCVATSPATENQARELGLAVEPFAGLDALDLAIDGADQIARDDWLIKGGGAAHTREKIVAAAADRFVVIASAEKLVERLRQPVPLELLEFGRNATLRSLQPAKLRELPPSPDGGLIADFLGEIGDPAQLAERLDATAGVISHGLFAPELVSEVIVGRVGQVERWSPGSRTPS